MRFFCGPLVALEPQPGRRGGMREAGGGPGRVVAKGSDLRCDGFLWASEGGVLLHQMLPLVPEQDPDSLNLVDVIAGAGIVAFGFYIHQEKYAPDYVYLPIIAIGAFILATCLFSIGGMCCWQSCCVCCLHPLSSSMGVILGMGEVTVGALLLANRHEYADWLDEHSKEYDISDDETRMLKDGIITAACLMFGLAVMEVMRCCIGGKWSAGMRQDDEEQKMMDHYEEFEAQQSLNRRASERKVKHKRLRQHYADKYNL
eukprot:CAMPEP_0197515584 /NCGR_PEP_ID=MMETSP1318-20131121/674_1 /TAXON_ID=552666 /ORGANISM="Partenskyella glossopodia, Strain RCC365" /LENGTH=257 /DNA_ID=CAMNT_0043063999 /DNA_START=158 /DNA_END=931 /DNA_ORIENTATION=-